MSAWRTLAMTRNHDAVKLNPGNGFTKASSLELGPEFFCSTKKVN